MKRIVFLSSLIILGIIFSACTDKKVLKYIPQTADAVVVISPDQKLSETCDPDALEDILDEFGFDSDERSLVHKLVDNPKSMGIDLSKTMAGWMEFDKQDLDEMVGGFVVAVSDVDALESSLHELNGKFLKFSNIQKQNGISYIYPNKNKEGTIIGWNNKYLIMMVSTSRIQPTDVISALYRDKGFSILTNHNFKEFSDNLTDVNLWLKSDVFAKELKKEKDVNNMLKDANIDLAGNYLHVYLTLDKKEYRMEVVVSKNPSLQRADWTKIIQAYFRNIDDYNY